MGNMVFVRGWPWMGNVVWFVDGGIWGMGVFVDGNGGWTYWTNGGNLKLKQI